MRWVQVLEETGYDIKHLLEPDDYIEYKMSEQLSRLYLIPGVSMQTKFEPRTRNEIRVGSPRSQAIFPEIRACRNKRSCLITLITEFLVTSNPLKNEWISLFSTRVYYSSMKKNKKNQNIFLMSFMVFSTVANTGIIPKPRTNALFYCKAVIITTSNIPRTFMSRMSFSTLTLLFCMELMDNWTCIWRWLRLVADRTWAVCRWCRWCLQKLEWFRIEWLPAHKKDLLCKQHYSLNPNAFFMVIPFIKWVDGSLSILTINK